MDADLLIVGGGAAGVAAAMRGRELGASVAVFEQAHLGGTCLHRGCVPSVTAVEFASRRLTEHAAGAADFGPLHHRQNNLIKQIATGTRLYLEQAGVTLIDAEGLLIGPDEVETHDSSGERARLVGRAVLLARGAGFVLPSVPGIDLPGVWTTDHALNADTPPADLVVYGGGFIGVEWAQFFHVFGSRVTLLEPGPTLLPGEDREIAEILQYLLAESGIEVVLNAPVRELEAADRGRIATVGLEARHEAERFLVADCRRPLLSGLPVAELGLATRGGALVVDPHQATSVVGIYAAGDLIGGRMLRMLSPFARAEGIIAAEAALGLGSQFQPAACPRAYHTRPEVAAVGLTAAEAQAAGHSVVIGRSELSYNARALTLGQEIGLAKVVARRPDGRVLGVHLIGPQATELIAQAVLAVRLEALAEDLASIVHGHPTLAESITEAAQDAVRQLCAMPQTT